MRILSCNQPISILTNNYEESYTYSKKKTRSHQRKHEETEEYQTDESHKTQNFFTYSWLDLHTTCIVCKLLNIASWSSRYRHLQNLPILAKILSLLKTLPENSEKWTTKLASQIKLTTIEENKRLTSSSARSRGKPLMYTRFLWINEHYSTASCFRHFCLGLLCHLLLFHINLYYQFDQRNIKGTNFTSR